MGTVSPPPGSLGPRGKKTGAGWPAIVLVAVVAALLFTAARGYLKSQEKPPAPVVQLTAAVVHVQPTAAPASTPVPTVDLERDLRIAEEFLKKHLKAPSTYKRISSLAVWGRSSGHRFRIEYDAQNSYGALIRECYYVPFPPLDPPRGKPGTPCDIGDSLGWKPFSTPP
jgi:hypothetical protein